jgi:hypothetical protein
MKMHGAPFSYRNSIIEIVEKKLSKPRHIGLNNNGV